jgi:sigma-70-like protein
LWPFGIHWGRGTGLVLARGSCLSAKTDRHRGKFEQPQNWPPAFAPDLAVRRIIFEPHFGQAGVVSEAATVAAGPPGEVAAGAWCSGDVEKFSALVREHQAGLRAFLRALGVEADWVDDLAQEVFLVAYRKQAEFESGKEFGRWLRGIARRLAQHL